MYEYNAVALRVIDGDTVILRVDVGFRIWIEMSFRLLGIDAPELNQIGGAASRDHLDSMIAMSHLLRIQTTKADKYGRWLVTIWNDLGVNVNEQMILDGYAVSYP